MLFTARYQLEAWTNGTLDQSRTYNSGDVVGRRVRRHISHGRWVFGGHTDIDLLNIMMPAIRVCRLLLARGIKGQLGQP